MLRPIEMFSIFLLLLPGSAALADQPARISGAMAFDFVGDGREKGSGVVFPFACLETTPDPFSLLIAESEERVE